MSQQVPAPELSDTTSREIPTKVFATVVAVLIVTSLTAKNHEPVGLIDRTPQELHSRLRPADIAMKPQNIGVTKALRNVHINKLKVKRGVWRSHSLQEFSLLDAAIVRPLLRTNQRMDCCVLKRMRQQMNRSLNERQTIACVHQLLRPSGEVQPSLPASARSQNNGQGTLATQRLPQVGRRLELSMQIGQTNLDSLLQLIRLPTCLGSIVIVNPIISVSRNAFQQQIVSHLAQNLQPCLAMNRA